ncbi:MAG: sigma-70 family RNA polymerase sigma factor [Lachnospiraceae bacterium]|nr:sigma-70 family RNA polymerase sigma factor [Lachnospiraceae bacterium]
MGDNRIEETRRRLMEENLRLVPFIIHRLGWYPPEGTTYEEMLQNGYLGLAEAARQYDPERGSFSTIAALKIMDHVSRGIQRELRYEDARTLSLDDWKEREKRMYRTYEDPVGDSAQESVLGESLLQLMEGLEEDEREVILLHFYGEVSLRRIALIRGCGKNVIIRTRDRALKKLKAALEGERK